MNNDAKCIFCSLVDKTIEHLLWECEYVNKFLKEAISLLSQQNLHIPLNKKAFLFGLDKDTENIIYATQSAAKTTLILQCLATHLSFYMKHTNKHPF